MPDQFCKPYDQCTKLDGRLLINQTLIGPPVAVGGDIGIGEIAGKGVLRPYCRFDYSQQWIPQEVCMAPVRSVIGLAPGETMTIETRQVEQVDFTRLVQNAIEKSDVVTTSGPASQMRDREGLDQSDCLRLGQLWVNHFGSWYWDLASDVGKVAARVYGGAAGGLLAGFFVDALENYVGGSDDGGSGTGNDEIHNKVDETLESVSRSESRRTVTETTTSRTNLFERAVARTFANPYRDRALQLRFIPVFRRFEVVTTFFRFEHGLALELLEPQFKQASLSARLGDFIQRQVDDQRIVSVAASELGLQEVVEPARKTGSAGSPLTAHLSANAEFYAKRYLRYLYARRDLDTLQSGMLKMLGTDAGGSNGRPGIKNALVWPRTQVHDKALYVPLTGDHVAVEALGIEKEKKLSKDYLGALDRIKQFRLKQVSRKRDVQLFMGTHIEAVAGECVLPQVPSPAPV